MKNALPRFFEAQDFDWRAFVANVADLLDLVALALPEPAAVDPVPVKAAAAFVSSFRRFFDASPEEIMAALGKAGCSPKDRLESLCPGVFGGTSCAPPSGTGSAGTFLCRISLDISKISRGSSRGDSFPTKVGKRSSAPVSARSSHRWSARRPARTTSRWKPSIA